MYIQVTEIMFKDAFRSIRPDNFSNEGLSELFHFFEDMGQDIELKLDVIAICCEFSEEPLTDVLEDYGLESLKELQDNTIVVAEIGDNVVYQVF